jgi:spoIIIJ-associated protein
VDEAVATAAAALDLAPESLRYELVEEGRRGILGLGARPTRIRVLEQAPATTMTAAREPAPERSSPSSSAVVDVRTTLERILSLARLELSVRAVPTGAGVRLVLHGKDRKLLLQRDAELLAALQVVLQRMARRRWPGAGSVQVDCEGAPRRGDDDELVAMAREVAEQVLRTGEPKRLPQLNPYERRLVHVTVGSYPGLTSTSEGEGFLKPVTVARARPSD